MRISVTWLLRCVVLNPQIIQTYTFFLKKNWSRFVYLIISSPGAEREEEEEKDARKRWQVQEERLQVLRLLGSSLFCR